MAQYESDSSELDDEEYTETNVLLGYTSRETCEDIVNHLGGRPQWIDPKVPPSATMAMCKSCNDIMVLLLQLNGDLPEKFPGHVRRLYIWICRKSRCRRRNGSVRALRGVQINEISIEEVKKNPITHDLGSSKKPELNLGEALFGANPFSNTNEIPLSNKAKDLNPFKTSTLKFSENKFSAVTLEPSIVQDPAVFSSDKASCTSLSKTFAESLYLNDHRIFKPGPAPPLKPWPQDSNLPPALPLLYLVDSDYETLDKEENKISVPFQMMGLNDEDKQGSSKEDKVVFESSIDHIFQKFADRMGQNPEQVIRYEFSGQPLLYSQNDSVGKIFSEGTKGNLKITSNSGSANSNRIPRCENCGAARVFELQLTPQAITELERDENTINDGMEWGTIIIGVCEKDCQQRGISGSDVGYLEEWVGVQWEELK
ncbi:putative 20S rRNA accumulation protein 4 [Golovinomyces cichoracearum]|uniref:Putative 20S rRNA accumulation protein 4 n=1 Tax=Golovinomyces cichoracearum TaxID=62708 RepID=A0A420HL39_9PEZI|nr:putative 20S rRNA accumulation protein 4 [Golovinomyces cichoracearum]